MEIASSGALVPNAIIVNPITNLDTFKFLAVDDAPSTNISAPLINTINPTNNIIICKNICIISIPSF